MALKPQKLHEPAPIPVDRLAGLDMEGLLQLRSDIELRLDVDITNLDLANELGLLYRSGQILLNNVQSDLTVPASQRAQVYSSVKGMLSQIIREQDLVYSAERLKRFEVAFLKVLQQMPEEAKHTFFDLYSEFLKDPDEPR